MNDKWINDLKKKMEDHTVVEPEGLWDDIEQSLFGSEKGKVIPLWNNKVSSNPTVRSTKGKKLQKSAIAAAATLLVGGSLWLFVNSNDKVVINTEAVDVLDANRTVYTKEDKNTQPENLVAPVVNKSTAAEQDVRLIGEGKINRKQSNPKENIQPFSTVVLPREEQVVIQQEKQEFQQKWDADTVKATMEEQLKSAVDALVQTDLQPKNKQQDQVVFAIDAEPAESVNKQNKFSFGLFSGNMSSNANQKQNGYVLMNSGVKLDGNNPNVTFPDKALTEIYTANLNKEVTTSIHHKRPVRFGMSFYYQISDNWGINSGLTYSKLSSELHSGSEAHKVINEQTLHYIGIPVQVNYNIWQKGRFVTYANGGFNVEKSVAGTLKTRYKKGETVEEGKRENVSNKGIQTSVNIATGIEYKLSKDIGLYVEPGMRYHFDDGSSIKTIYKEKPLDFSVQIGLRYSFMGNKNKKEQIKE